MYQERRIGAVILIGGEGSRFGGAVPKQFLMLEGRRVYLRTLEAFEGAGIFDEVVLVCHRSWMEEVSAEAPGCRVVEGRATRQGSSLAGLRGFGKMPEIVAIHDGVRPFVSQEILVENVRTAVAHGAADTCIASADTLVHAPNGNRIESIPKREEYLRGQTPQTFRYDRILEAHEAALKDGIENASDDCRLVLRMGRSVQVVRGSETNIKITTEFDFAMAEMLCKRPSLKSVVGVQCR
jgi:2-C-methyl-D-erythritol 4-phosphate cytidylyltransferase